MRRQDHSAKPATGQPSGSPPAVAGVGAPSVMSHGTIPPGPAPAPPTALAPSTSVARTHCPYRQADQLQQALISNKLSVGFLLGAGCPVSIRVPEGTSTRALIPDVTGLTKAIKSTLAKSSSGADYEVITQRLVASGNGAPNIEQILSHIRALSDIVGHDEIGGLSSEKLDALDRTICSEINGIVDKSLPSQDTPYHQLATWIAALPREQPVEVFTSNYDLLMEQALEDREVPYFDGFSGSRQAFFDLPSIEQRALTPRWARLWKIHGSVNWWQTEDRRIQRRTGVADGDRLLIYPSHLKYDASRRMPYLAMLDRLRAFLTGGRVALVTCGYSFADDHVNDVIARSLLANPKASCFGLVFGDRASCAKGVALARNQANLSLLAADGAVLGSVEADWHAAANPDHPLHGQTIAAEVPAWRSKAPPDRCKLLLGDFAALGSFLALDLASRDRSRGASDDA